MARLRPGAPGRERGDAAPGAPANRSGCGAFPGLAQRTLHAPLEPLDLAGGVDDVLGAGVERVAIRADLDADRLHGRPDRECGPADAMDLRLMVLRMNIGLHGMAPGILRLYAAGDWGRTTLTRFL